jgi:general secretion pathway protein C
LTHRENLRIAFCIIKDNQPMFTLNFPVWRLRLTTFLLAAMAAASAAYWVLKWTSPTPPLRAPAALPPTQTIDTSKIAQLLGASATSAAKAPATSALDSYKLMGVIAQGSQGTQGSALIAIDGKPAKPYRVGDKVSDTLVLHSVTARGAALAASLQAPIAGKLELPAMAAVKVPPTASKEPNPE